MNVLLYIVIVIALILSLVSTVFALRKPSNSPTWINLKKTTNQQLTRGVDQMASWQYITKSDDDVLTYDINTRLINIAEDGVYMLNFSGSFELPDNGVERLVWIEPKLHRGSAIVSLCAASDQIAITERLPTTNRGSCSVSYIGEFKAGDKIGLLLGSGDDVNAIFIDGSVGNIVKL